MPGRRRRPVAWSRAPDLRGTPRPAAAARPTGRLVVRRAAARRAGGADRGARRRAPVRAGPGGRRLVGRAPADRRPVGGDGVQPARPGHPADAAGGRAGRAAGVAGALGAGGAASGDRVRADVLHHRPVEGVDGPPGAERQRQGAVPAARADAAAVPARVAGALRPVVPVGARGETRSSGTAYSPCCWCRCCARSAASCRPGWSPWSGWCPRRWSSAPPSTWAGTGSPNSVAGLLLGLLLDRLLRRVPWNALPLPARLGGWARPVDQLD